MASPVSAFWGASVNDAVSGRSAGRSRVSLNGEWERYIDTDLYGVVAVPSSQSPMGFYLARREFLLPRLVGGQRAILHFDAITYYGEVSMNGKRLGTMGPYVPYEFEFTAEAKEGSNQVEVGIADLTPAPDGEGKPELELGVSPVVMEHTVDRLMDLVETKRLAGHSFWSWQDLRQYSRIDEEMHHGVLESGVVTESREPRHVPYMELSRLFEGRRPAETPASTKPMVLPLQRIPWDRNSSFVCVDLHSLVDAPAGRQSWQAFEGRMAAFWAKSRMAQDQWKRTGKRFLLWKGSEIRIAGVRFLFPVVDGYTRPLMLTPESPEVVISLDQQGTRLHILGNVTLPEGFPVSGDNREIIAHYTVQYTSGDSDNIPLRNGYEVARSNLIDEATRINPEAINAQRALPFVKDIAREHYQINLLTIPVRAAKLQSLRCALHLHQPPLAIFGVTAEFPSAGPAHKLQTFRTSES